MSDDLIEMLWDQFTVETEEHLQAMEPILVDAESEPLGADEIGQLFRSMHSFKGLSKAMNLLSIEAIAHRSEDLLGLIRDEGVEFTPERVSILLDALDALQVLIELAVDTREDGEMPTDLVKRLEKVYNEAKGGSSAPVAEPIPEPIPEPEVVVEEAPVEAEKSDNLPPLHDDDLLEFFDELCQQYNPEIAKLIYKGYDASADGKNIVDAIDGMLQAAGGLEFTNMADTLTELYEILKPDGEIEDDQRDQVFQLLSDYREMLDVVVSSSSINGYVGAFKDDTEKLDIDKDLLETTNDLESLSKLLTGSHIDNNVRKVVHYCKAINARFTIAAPHQPLAPIYLLEDVFSRIQDKEFSLHEKLVEISVTAVDITHKIVLGFIDKTSYVDIGLINEHIETFQKIITHELSAEAGDDEDHHEFLENYGIKPHFMELLTAVNIHDLRKSIDEGNDVYEIVADLDGDMTVTQAFVGWMQENGQSITSRTVFDGDEKTKFDFLYVSSLSPADAKKQIEDITADKSLLALTSIHDGASEEVVAPVASEKVEESVKTAATEEKEVVAPSVEAKKPAEKAKPSKAKTNTTIRVESETLDRFMNQLGELVLARGMLTHAILGLDIQESFNAVNGFVGELDKNNESANGQSLDVVKKALTVLESQQDLIRQADLQIQTVLERLQEDALSLRVVPISTVFNRLPRVVRDLSVAQGKKVKLEMVGKEVRIDKGMVDMLVDPMIHMVRNSVDHGVELPEDRIKSNKSENAIVTISAKQQGDRVRIDIIDDGAGIDHQRVLDKAVSRGLLSERESQNINAHQALQYIFSPGLSTAEKVTETSGRGVGMDVVKNTIIQLGGEVSVASTVGEGSQMNIVLPLTAAIQTTLMMEINNQRVAIPDRNVEEVFEVAESEIQSVKGRRAILLRNSFLPIVHLSDILGFPRNQEERKNTPIAVIKNEEFRIGVEVDVLLHREELFLKDIHPDLAALPGVGGVSICGDGSVILVLDTDQLFELAAKFHEGDYLKMQKSQQNTDGLVAV